EMEKMQSLDADPGLVRAAVEDLLKMGTRRWQITGNGEPLLYRDSMELIGTLKASGSHCTVNTNGTLINFAMADELVKMKLDEVRITTMAGTPDVYVRTHPGVTANLFRELEQVLMYMAEQKAALKVRQPEITLAFVVIAQNYDNIFESAEFAAHVGASGVLFRPVDDIEDSGLAHTVPTEKQAITVVEQLSAAKRFFEARGIRHNIGYFRKSFHEQLDTEMIYRHIPCFYGWLSTVIDTDGKIYGCCRCYEPLGDMHQHKFSEIWHGSSYRRFRREGVLLHRRRKPVSGCDCYSCVHYTANLKVYKRLHPVKGRFRNIESIPVNENV
ncbi:SPASM domain-containing protein, partial [bacterium]|nr:SPASM domain-containing protein [bacterium]